MQESARNEEKLSNANDRVRPPRGLFARIISRLGLEKQLQLIKRNLGLFSVAVLVSIIIAVFAFMGLRHILLTSNFGPFMSLAYREPGMVIRHSGEFSSSFFESMPGGNISFLLFSSALLLIFIRLVAVNWEKLMIIINKIKNKKYGKSN